MAWTWTQIASGRTGVGVIGINSAAAAHVIEWTTMPAWIPALPSHYGRHATWGWAAYSDGGRIRPLIRLTHNAHVLGEVPIHVDAIEYNLGTGVVARIHELTGP